MSRLACPEPPGLPLHVVLRGAGADLAEVARAARCAVHAYARMATHTHVLITSSRPRAASRLAAALGAAGFDATPVLPRRYLLACMRYIEMNPVRAGLVRHPAQYRRSSYRANALGEPDALVSPHPAYCALGRDAAERQAAYRALFTSRAPRPAC